MNHLENLTPDESWELKWFAMQKVKSKKGEDFDGCSCLGNGFFVLVFVALLVFGVIKVADWTKSVNQRLDYIESNFK